MARSPRKWARIPSTSRAYQQKLRLAEPVGQLDEGVDRSRRQRKVTALHVGDDLEPSRQQLELRVTGPLGGGEHLCRCDASLVGVARAGVGVAPGRQALGERTRVSYAGRDRHGLLGHRHAASLLGAERRRHRQSRQQHGPQGRVVVADRLEGLVQQRQLGGIEQAHLEPSAERSDAQRGEGERLHITLGASPRDGSGVGVVGLGHTSAPRQRTGVLHRHAGGVGLDRSGVPVGGLGVHRSPQGLVAGPLGPSRCRGGVTGRRQVGRDGCGRPFP